MKTLRDHLAANLPVYILVAVLSGLVAFYSLVFIPMNEGQLNRHIDRLLMNKAKTVSEKYNGYKAAIESSPMAYAIGHAFAMMPERDTLVYAYPKTGDTDKVYFGASQTKLSSEIEKVLGKKPVESDLMRISRKDLERAAIDKTLKPQTKGGSRSNQEQNLWQVASGNYHFVYELDETYFNTDLNKVVHPYFWLYVKGFMENIKHNDFFDDLFLVATDTLAKGKRQILDGQAETGAVLDRSSLGLVRFDIPDSIRKMGTGFFYRRISGQNYVGYAKEIKLRRNLSVYLVGLIEKSKLVSKAREVPAWFVVFCSTIALLLIFMMPIIKLFSINKSERLLSRDARLAVFSMILTLSLGTVLLEGSYLFWGLERDSADKDLKSLVNRMGISATHQVDTVVSALHDPKIFNCAAGRLYLQASNVRHYNEAILVSIDDWDKMGGAVTNAYSENIDYLVKKFPLKLGSREYIKMPKSALDNNVQVEYFLQAFNSYSSGLAEIGISTLRTEKKEVAVITSRLPAIINATVPSPFHFVVTDKKGEIKFNSRWKEVQIENFISECNDDAALSNHIHHDVTGFVDFTYLNFECHGYGKPILKDWYLIVYRELSTTKNLAAEVFGLCLLTLAIVTLGTGLIHLCLLLDRKKSTILETRDFIYHWLNPFSAPSSRWIELTFFCLLLFLAEVVWTYLFYSILSAIFFVLICITLFYLFVYSSLSNTSRADNKLSDAMKWLIFLLVLWTVSLIIVAVVDGQRSVLIFLLPFTLIVGLFAKKARSLFTWASKTKPYLAYRFFLMSSLLVIAIGPSTLFLSDHYYYTSLSIKYHCLLDDLLKIQVHDSNDIAKLHGDDYINHSLKVKSHTREQADSLFYGFVQGLQPQTPTMSNISLGYLPNSKGFASFHNHDSLMVMAPTSTLSPSPMMSAGRVLDNLRWVNNGPSYVIVLINLIAVAGLWYILRLLPRKIFFAPDLIVWDCFQDPKSSNFLELEFENDEDTRHPLYKFNPQDKTALLAMRDSPKSKSEYAEDPQAFRDGMIFKLQEKAEDLYEVIWRRCTDEEKYFLYDLASDGVANQANQVLIGRLAEKRLVRLRPHLKPVNVSFANYVLKAMTVDEIDQWSKKESEQGNWKNLKWTLLILIAAVFIFLSVAEENFLGRVTAILASIGLVVPQIANIITSMGGIFKKG